MRTLFNKLFLIFIVSAFSFQSKAQEANDEGYGGRWFLGLNGGAAWQQSDVKSRLGSGAGLYIGKNIIYSPTSPLSFDLRFRFLGTNTYGQDWRQTDIDSTSVFAANTALTTNYNSLGYLYLNHKTSFTDLAIEGRFNFENLRRKNKILLAIYGGAGLGIYSVKYDQLRDNNPYSSLYASINSNTNLSNDQIVNQIVDGRDRDYETAMSEGNKITFTPNVGMELGYWFTPRFAMGVGHRVNWTFQDDFDGVVRGNGNNIHHYAHLFMHFHFGKGRTRRTETVNNVNNFQTVNTVTPKPVVDFTMPINNPATVSSSPTRIRATVQHVETNSGVMLYVNNAMVNNFTFNPSTDVLEATISLIIGTNTVRVVGTNSSGADDEQITITYQPVQNITQPQPSVEIYNPNTNPFTTNVNYQTINAYVNNVPSASNINFTINGQVYTNFNFSGNVLTAANVLLNVGTNNIVISAFNEGSTASDQVTINFQPVRSALPPTVNITNPATDPFNTSSSLQNISAQITNISNPADIRFTVNGQISNNFSLNGTLFTAANVSLQQGNNTVVIQASNIDGNASDQVTINYQPVRIATPPTVNITNPATDPHSTSSNLQNISAVITNLANPADIRFTVNGQLSNNFSLNGTLFSAPNVSLQQGNNLIIIQAGNVDGNATDQVTINYNYLSNTNNIYPPTVNITNPSLDPYTTTIASQTINALVTNISNVNNIRLMVNGVQITNVGLVGTYLTANNVNLIPGRNLIEIVATNQYGTANDNTVVLYQAPANYPPTVNITNPSVDPFSTNTGFINIEANVNNINSTSNIRFTVNNQLINNFNLNGNNFSASNISLQPGNNTIVITATNPYGTASDQTIVVYNTLNTTLSQAGTINPPTVKITTPSVDPLNTSSTNQNITATITNISNPSNVTFTINGINYSNFTLTGTSFVANNITLPSTRNVVVISATNQGGTASDQTIIIYQAPVNPPTVNITNPRADSLGTTNNSINIQAAITDVNAPSGVTFTINGQSNTNFSLSGTNFTASNVVLQPGNNIIVITAVNGSGRATDQVLVVYNTQTTTLTQANVAPPTVNITSPTANPFSTGLATTTVTATVTGVVNSGQVQFIVNGQNITNFTISGNTLTASNVSLNPGSNTIIINVSNSSGNASDNTVIIFNQPLAPVVRITEPSVNPYNTTSPNAMIRATVQNVRNQSNIAFTVNGQYVTNFTFNAPNFVATNIPIRAGANTFTITANNNTGTDSESTIINYEPVDAPTITDMTAGAQATQNQGCNVRVYAGLNNVNNINEITFRVNGVVTTGFTFINNVLEYAQTITSNNPSQIVYTITVTNNGGTVTETRTVNVGNCAIVSPPNVSNSNVSIGQQNGNCMAMISANISNINSNSQITFTINGQTFTNFNFRNGQFSANINLNNITNKNVVFVITATNSAGTDSETVTGSLSNCASVPVITNMAATQQQVRGSFFATVTANISGIQNASQIVFLVNGQPYTNFSFANGVFTAVNVPVSPGRNSFTITATNLAGTDSENASLTASGNTGGSQNGTNNSTNTLDGQPVPNNPNSPGNNNNSGGNNGGNGGNQTTISNGSTPNNPNSPGNNNPGGSGNQNGSNNPSGSNGGGKPLENSGGRNNQSVTPVKPIEKKPGNTTNSSIGG